MQSTERLHALDAVRAWALLVGVFFHAALSFVTSYTKGMFEWVIEDNSQSQVLLSFIGTSHLFRMSLFFLIAGFFAHLVYHRKGAGAFATNRLTRIALPFVVGLCILIPLDGYIWTVGYEKAGKALPFEAGTFLSRLADGYLPLQHLWFLYYLLLFYVLIVGTRYVLIDRIDASQRFRNWVDGVFRRSLDGKWTPLLIAVPMGLVAIFDTSFQGGGLPTPDRSLLPELIPTAAYGSAFAAGWLLHRNVDLLEALGQRTRGLWFRAIAVAFVGSLCVAVLAMKPGFLTDLLRPLSAFSWTAVTWYVDFALIGLALQKLSAPSARTRYIADASYWIYIAHLPVVCALQVWVAYWPLHWTIKYTFIMAVAFAVLFASYHYLVRYSFIGAVLNGRKVRERSLDPQQQVTTG